MNPWWMRSTAVLIPVVAAGIVLWPASVPPREGAPIAGPQLWSAVPIAEQETAQGIVAQGKILPWGGIVEITAPPGDVIQQVLVRVGEPVRAGQKLLVMASEAPRQLQIEALEAALDAARFAHEQSVASAQHALDAAKLELQRLDAASQGLVRRQELIDLAQKQFETAQSALDKLERIARDEALKGFVDETELLRQRLAVQEAERELLDKRIAMEEATQRIQWGRKAGELQLRAAQRALAAAQGVELRRMEKELEAARAQFEAALVRSPLDGVVLAVDVQAGEAGAGMPAIACANVERLICEAEVNVIDAGQVEPGAAVEIHSPAFGDRVLRGTVSTRHPLVGTPLLKPLNPLARTDFRAVKVDIEIDQQDCQAARTWLQLQVEVLISRPRRSAGSAETAM